MGRSAGVPRRVAAVLCAIVAAIAGGCAAQPSRVSRHDLSVRATTAMVATSAARTPEGTIRDWRRAAVRAAGDAWEPHGLSLEPSADVPARLLSAGLSFYASISSVSTRAVTFDVLTGHDVPDYGTDLTNHHRHSQTLLSTSARIPVLLEGGDDSSLPGPLSDSAAETAVTLQEFGSLVKADPARFVGASDYVIHVAPGGRVELIARVADPG